MGLPNPFLPAGFLPTPQQRQRAQARTGVIAILTAHFILLIGLLIQGCKTEDPSPVPLFSDVPGVTTPKPAPASAPAEPASAPAPAVQPAPTTTTAPLAPEVTTAAPAPTPAVRNAETTYKIKAGDTLSGIAKKFHTSVAALKKLNRLKSDTIVAGKSLRIPAAAGR